MKSEPGQLPEGIEEGDVSRPLNLQPKREGRTEVEHRRAFLAGDPTARPMSMGKEMTPESHPGMFGSANVKRTKD